MVMLAYKQEPDKFVGGLFLSIPPFLVAILGGFLFLFVFTEETPYYYRLINSALVLILVIQCR